MKQKNDKSFVKWSLIIPGILIFFILLYSWIFTSEDLVKKIIITLAFVLAYFLAYLAFMNQKKQDAKN